MQVQQLSYPTLDTALSADSGFDSVAKDIKVIALVKGEERYVFTYSEDNRAETLRLLGRYASNPELSFTWYDAAVLSQKIRQESLQQKREKQRTNLNAPPFSSIPLELEELF